MQCGFGRLFSPDGSHLIGLINDSWKESEAWTAVLKIIKSVLKGKRDSKKETTTGKREATTKREKLIRKDTSISATSAITNDKKRNGRFQKRAQINK